MSYDLMTICDQKKQFKVGEAYEWRWTPVNVSEIVGLPNPRIRCAHCRGAVRLHRQHVEHGPRDHVEHRSRHDSEHCRGGHYFQGDHRLSSRPLEWAVQPRGQLRAPHVCTELEGRRFA
jgi:hypothetical protein